jgi:hypothetical protein
LSREKEEKPKIELLQSSELFTVELCNPIKDQIEKIKLCSPNVIAKPCSPLEKMKCIPEVICSPIVGPCLPQRCLPVIGPCLPALWCIPRSGPCIPTIWCGPQTMCGPLYGGGVCGPSVQVPVPEPGLSEIASKVEKLAAEVADLKKRIAK